MSMALQQCDSEDESIRQHAKALTDKVQGLQIIDDQSFRVAGEILLTIKTYIGKAKEFCRPNIQRWHEGWKKALSDEKALVEPYENAERLIKPRLAVYHDEQERRRREEEERLRQEAIRKAEDDRLHDAVSAEQFGMTDLSDAILDGPAYAPTVVAPAKAVKIDGVSFRDNWKAEVFEASFN